MDILIAMEGPMWWAPRNEHNGGEHTVSELPCREELVSAVAAHEKLTPSVARQKVAALLGQSWGPPAIRQMIQDEIDRAATSGRWPNIDDLIDTYQWCCDNLPTGNDRRTQARAMH